jgi:hypothetical protein
LSCCSANYTSQIDAGADSVTLRMTSRFFDLSPACYDAFQRLACVACSPTSSAFITHTAGEHDILRACESLCNRVYAACAGAKIVGTGAVRLVPLRRPLLGVMEARACTRTH